MYAIGYRLMRLHPSQLLGTSLRILMDSNAMANAAHVQSLEHQWGCDNVNSAVASFVSYGFWSAGLSACGWRCLQHPVTHCFSIRMPTYDNLILKIQQVVVCEGPPFGSPLACDISLYFGMARQAIRKGLPHGICQC